MEKDLTHKQQELDAREKMLEEREKQLQEHSSPRVVKPAPQRHDVHSWSEEDVVCVCTIL